MNNISYPHLLLVVLSWLVMLPAKGIAAPELLYADVTGDDSSQPHLQMRFVRDFSNFTGSDANAQSLYTGLKHGKRITLAAPPTTTSSGSTATPVVQFDPPTRQMGNNNVFISAMLAKQLLENYGITKPTPQQLQAVLTGGAIRPAEGTKPVSLKGILVQRAEGMGWGSIAKFADMKIGKVVSGYKTGKPVTAAGSHTVATSAGNAVNSGSSMHATGSGRAGSVSARFTTVGGGVASPQLEGQGLISQ